MSTENQTSQPKVLTSEEICSIIRQCGESKVLKLDFMGLSLTFREPVNEITEQSFAPTQHTYINPEPPTKSQAQPTASATPWTPEDIEDELLAIENPVEYERRQLEDDTNGKVQHFEAQ